jgi:DNA repair exonuclease SbcCD nuclease subunit
MADFIITGDWHLRKTNPICRTDKDWMALQKNKIQQVKDMAEKLNATILNTADIFHRAISSPELELLLSDIEMITLPVGNHDYEYHRYGDIQKNSLEVIGHFPGITLKGEDPEEGWKMIHELVFPNEEARPQIKDKIIGITAEEFLEKYPDFKWLFTGDYHRNFHFEKDGRHVVNAGCLTRQNADFMDYKPGVYFVDTTKEVVDFNPLEIPEDVMTDLHIREEEERNERMDAFIETVKSKKGITLDFPENLRNKKDVMDDSLEKEILSEIIEEIA